MLFEYSFFDEREKVRDALPIEKLHKHNMDTGSTRCTPHKEKESGREISIAYSCINIQYFPTFEEVL